MSGNRAIPDGSEQGDIYQRTPPQIQLRALRWSVPLDADIWQRQKDLGWITPGDEEILTTARNRVNWGMFGLVIGAAVPAVWGKFIAKPNWRPMRIFWLSAGASIPMMLLGQLVEAVTDNSILQECANPRAVVIGYSEALRDQMERQRALLKANPSPKVAAAKKRELERQRQDDFMNPPSWQSPPGSDSAENGLVPNAGAEPGPVTQELEKQPNGWRWSDRKDSMPRPPRPTPAISGSETEARPESAWEALRRGRLPGQNQKQTGEQKQQRSATPVPDYQTGLDDFQEPASPEETAARRKAQKEFDDMLERERKFGQEGEGRRRPGGSW
ncbi:hypothetical protein DACRYDRAFT_15648 [Dacryopinax primogenitus]|uniref:Uncharacterized protein n=1 Tax=Dacryopinax primogenitus (strain DJM 731) TaxID=1858805 RepID=M5G903_DACPD|nr:uncharacterized protein DACRYDRAFT_15648 [Dacryopinax primogenitus]EJU02352.1 hypothetical protein DACRYDRAFT_15648 [Dacryopinax primogenitus]